MSATVGPAVGKGSGAVSLQFLDLGKLGDEAPEMGTQRRILVVDDSNTVAWMIERALQAHGYEVFTAFDGEDGLEKARALNPDLIILDIVMPGIDGYEVCRRLKADPDTASIGVLLLTARGDFDGPVVEDGRPATNDRSQSRDFDVGADDFLTKPVTVKELMKRVKLLLQAGGRGA